MVNKFERESPVVKEYIISKQEGSEIGNLESELEPVQLQGGDWRVCSWKRVPRRYNQYGGT